MAWNAITISLLFLFSSLNFLISICQPTWIRAGHWDSASELPVAGIDSTHFSHLTCAFARINFSTYHIQFNSSKEQSFFTFSSTIKSKNPSVVSILSIRGGGNSYPVFSSMINQSSSRKSFIDSSIDAARLHGFDGLELAGVEPKKTINMSNLGTLLEEWRAAISTESKNGGNSELLLVMAGYYLPGLDLATYPIGSITSSLDWVHLIAYDYYVPTRDNVTLPHAALYGPPGMANSNDVIKEWLRLGVPSKKLVLGLPYHGYDWLVVNPRDNSVGEVGLLASGPAVTIDGSMGYKSVKSFIKNYGYGAAAVYNGSSVANFFSVGSNWINFDDTDAIKAKVAFAKENKLLGYNVFQLSNDDNWILSLAAQGKDADNWNKKTLLVPILITGCVLLVLLATGIYCYSQKESLKSKGITGMIKRPRFPHLNKDAPNLQAFSFNTIRAATNNFSSENKLGEGGFGPVYKGKLPNGKDIAVKRLSKTSHQGADEFKTEVTLTAKLQHLNLLRVRGFCTEREEKMLIYEYMPNKSLDYYLHDPSGRYILDWRKRVRVIEGVTQGLLYLQEYSNYTIIHRDLKANNILLDEKMNPKISDFGMARLFRKDELEAKTGRIVGTYGYVPPEYVRKGIYSTKYDVYSFGVLLLQIISGKRTSCYYGPNENLNLLDYAFDLWNEGKGMEFMDPTLDDSTSSCKLMICLQVALLCVQENPLDRPSMLEVSLMLKIETSAIGSPKRPAFSVKRDEDEDCALKGSILSAGDATISELVPR